MLLETPKARDILMHRWAKELDEWSLGQDVHDVLTIMRYIVARGAKNPTVRAAVERLCSRVSDVPQMLEATLLTHSSITGDPSLRRKFALNYLNHPSPRIRWTAAALIDAKEDAQSEKLLRGAIGKEQIPLLRLQMERCLQK